MQFLYGRIPPKYSYNQEMHNINMSIRKFKIGARATLIKQKGKIILKNNIQIGGKTKETEIKGTKYEYNVEIGIPHATDQKIIMFLNISGINENCALIMYDTIKSKGTTAILHGIMNDEDCIQCLDLMKKYKTGDILMQIIIKYIQNSKKLQHIKTLELQDTSIKKCFDKGIQLIYLKMMTDGRTYYSKYGFKPKKVKEDYNEKSNLLTDYRLFKYNKNIFETNKELSKCDVIDVIKESILNDEEIYFYKKVITKILKEPEIIDTSLFMKRLVNLIYDENIDEEQRKIICGFTRNIYVNLYKKIGYREYSYDCLWTLRL